MENRIYDSIKSIPSDKRWEYDNKLSEIMTNTYRLIEFMWFDKYCEDEEARNYLKEKFDLTDGLIDYVLLVIKDTPVWMVRLANGIQNNVYDTNLGFKSFMDRKYGYEMICGNCNNFDRAINYCNKHKTYEVPETWRLCCTNEDKNDKNDKT